VTITLLFFSNWLIISYFITIKANNTFDYFYIMSTWNISLNLLCLTSSMTIFVP
jgi:hypothetical protein